MNRIENGFKCTDLHFLWHPYYYPDVVHYHQPPIRLQVIQNKLRTLLFFYTFYKFFTHHGMCSFSSNKNITSLRCRIEWRFILLSSLSFGFNSFFLFTWTSALVSFTNLFHNQQIHQVHSTMNKKKHKYYHSNAQIRTQCSNFFVGFFIHIICYLFAFVFLLFIFFTLYTVRLCSLHTDTLSLDGFLSMLIYLHTLITVQKL